METTQVPIDGWIDKENMVYTHNGILFSLQMKEILTNATMWRPLCQMKKGNHKKTNTVWVHLYEVFRVVKITETE